MKGRQLPLSDAGAMRSARNATGRRSRTLLAAAIALVLGVDSSHAATYIVNTTGDPGPGGTISLRQAIASANGSDANTIEFDASLVGSTITLADAEIPITARMSIHGPGADKLTISGNHSSRIFSIGTSSNSAKAYISGLTLANGHSAANGGALLVKQGATAYLFDTKVMASDAANGGGLYSSGLGLRMYRSAIIGNTASGSGGGIGGSFGVIRVVYSSLRANTAGYAGGGASMSGGRLLLQQSTVSGNTASAAPQGAHGGGGGIYLYDSYLTCNTSTIAGNYSYAGGGGILLNGFVAATYSRIYSTTVAGNSSCCYDSGNGITAISGTPYISATIVANNFNRGGSYDLAGSFYVALSLIRNPAGATITNGAPGTVFGVDPKLGALADNGGPTLTMVPAQGSPAVDALPGCLMDQNNIPPDQRGLPGCVNGNSDIGAVERQVPEVVIFRNGFDPGG